jgi:hypothetical protein
VAIRQFFFFHINFWTFERVSDIYICILLLLQDVPITGDELANSHACRNRHDIVIDSFLSQAHHVELERELEPWTPDKDAPENLGLEDTFQNTWNR